MVQRGRWVLKLYRVYVLNKNNNFTGIVVIIALISMIGPFSIDAYLPSFPSIEEDFLSSRALLSQTISMYMFATAISSLFWGPLSDRFGRKFVMLASLALYSAASLNCALASTYSEFLVSRILQGVAASGGLVAGRAMVRDVYDSRDAQRVMAYVLMIFALAPAIAPIIGGWLHHLFGWRSVFYFLSLYGLFMLLVSTALVSESLHQYKRKSFHPIYVLRTYVKALLYFRFLLIVMALGISFAGLFIYIAGAPTLIFDELKLETTDFWMLFVPITVGIIIGSFFSGKLIKQWSAEKVINMAFLIMFIGMILNFVQAIFIDTNIVLVIIPVFIYALGVALSMPGLAVMALDCYPENKGAAAAMQSFTQIMISGLVAGILLPAIKDNIIAFAVSQMVLLLVALLLWFLSFTRYTVRE